MTSHTAKEHLNTGLVFYLWNKSWEKWYLGQIDNFGPDAGFGVHFHQINPLDLFLLRALATVPTRAREFMNDSHAVAYVQGAIYSVKMNSDGAQFANAADRHIILVADEVA